MKRIWKKPMALLLTTAMLTANVGMVTAVASGESQKEDTKTEDTAEKANQVAAVKANPAEGSYEKSQKVTLTTATKDAVIYYTTDGKAPTTKSAKFDAKKPLEITKTTTVKAMAVKSGMENSKIASYTYTLKDKGLVSAAELTEKPLSTAAPAAEEESSQAPEGEAQLTQAPEQEQAGAETGTPQADPSETPKDLKPIEGTQTVSVEASVGNLLKDLSVKEKFTIPEGITVEEAVWSEAGMTETSDSAAIKLGGSYQVVLTLKTAEGFKFGSTAAFTLNASQGQVDPSTASNDTQRKYTFNLQAPTQDPTITPEPGEELLEEGTAVELKNQEASAIRWYKIGDSGEWKEYKDTEKILLTAENGICKVFYRASKNNIFTAEKTAEYKMNVKIAAPTANPKAGTYTKTQKVTLATATEGAKIYYTIDGTEPTKDSKEYTNPISVSKDTTVKAVAYLANGQYSEVAEFKYVIEEAPEPEIKQITKVAVTNLTRPAKGQKPDTKVKVSSSSHAVVESVEWTDDTSTKEEYTKRYKAATTYYVYIVLSAKAGYEFDVDALAKSLKAANPNAKINGTSCSVMDVDEDYLTIALGYKTAAGAVADSSKVSITGIASSYSKGATVTFKANGTSSVSGNATVSNEGDERYVPTKYSISSTNGDLTYDSNLVATKQLKFSSSGTYTLKVTFRKQVYDSNEGKWVDTEGTVEKSATIKISSTTSTTSTTKKASTTSAASKSESEKKSKGAKTGDETPIGALVGVMVVAGLATGGILITRKRRKDK